MFRGIWTGIVFLAATFAVLVYRCQCLNILDVTPDSFFRNLSNAIDMAVFVAVIWEVLTMILASIMRKEQLERGRREREAEIQSQIDQWRAQGVPAEEIVSRILAASSGNSRRKDT